MASNTTPVLDSASDGINCVRRLREISASTWCFAGTGLDGVIPLVMEGVAFDVEGRHFGVADSDALFIGIGVEFAADRQSRLGCGRRDQLDDRRPAREWPATPILRDVAEQAVFDLVPLGCAGRIMADDDGQSGLIGELLQFELP